MRNSSSPLLAFVVFFGLGLGACGDGGGPTGDADMSVVPDLTKPMDSNEVLDDDVVPCDSPQYWPFHVDSTKHPLTVNFRKADEEEVALEALGYLEHSWDVEVGQLGFSPPLDDSGLCGHNGNLDLFLWRDHDLGAIGASFTDALGDPKGGIEAYPVFMVIDAWGVQGGAILDATVAHEFNHSLQAADDWFDSVPIYEATAQFIEDQVYDDDNEYTNILYHFQGNPDWSLDRDDDYKSWYMYGAAIYLHYIRDAFYDGDAKFISDMWRRMRNAPDETDPDFEDALDAMLKTKGSSFMDSVTGFARWRWFTGANDDGAHCEEAASWDEVKTQGPFGATSGKHDLSPAPMLLGSGYLDITKGGGDPATVKVTLEAPANAKVRWVVQAVPGLTAGSDGEILNVSSGPANLSFPANGKRTIIVTAMPTGAYDPDERDDTRYPVSITVAP